MSETKILPFVILKHRVVFPRMMLDFDLTQTTAGEAARQAAQSGQEIFFALQREEEPENADASAESYEIGVIAGVKQIIRLPNNQTRILVQGSERARLIGRPDTELPYALAEVVSAPMEPAELSPVEEEALRGSLLELIDAFLQNGPKGNAELGKHLHRAADLARLLEQSIAALPMPTQEKQRLLEAENIVRQFEGLTVILRKEMQILQIRRQIQEKAQSNIDRNQKEYVLREQMRAIREELGETGPMEESERFRQEVEELDAPEEIKEVIRGEIRRFSQLGYNNSESSVVRNYIETMLALPWNRSSEEHLELANARRILERDHYGLEDVKKRVLEFLAVRGRSSAAPSPILCLVGPPGTGKTSIAKSMAEAMGRTYVRICLGGVRDEAEIRGHRRTYLAAMPGRFVQGLRTAKVNNPLMLLDEVDKIGSDYKGDPSAALLEVLDSAQNSRFVDHFIEQPVDLSKVVFVATANTTETIPKPLLDRMEILEISSYTLLEKLHIAKDYLVPGQLEKHGLTKAQLSFRGKALEAIIQGYTKEAGVRNLERRIGEVCRKAVLALAEQEEQGREAERFCVTEKNLENYLGVSRYRKETLQTEPEVGIVRGLAWTSVGGEVLEIEVNTMPGKGELVLTGRMGDVMKESAKTGISYLRSIGEEYGIASDYFAQHDIHIHIPEGAVPKDGPSAGITMASAVLSAVTDIPARQDLAMTGEITLRGRVLPIGGLKEKLLAAKLLGISSVLVPEKNRQDVQLLSEEIRDGMELTYVRDMKQVLAQVLTGGR
ncbi:MAG: endopeptidase La [Lachnospiraceae bacterium]|nr:endopeptidase La [Lachnospiraceae bacterium]